MKKIIILLLFFSIFRAYAMDQLFSVTLEVDKNELSLNQKLTLSFVIENLQNYHQKLSVANIYTALSYLRFYTDEDGVTGELQSGVNSTVSKRFEDIMIQPRNKIILTQEIEFLGSKLFDLKTLTDYSGFVLVLKKDGIFIPIRESNKKIVIAGRLKHGDLLFESNIQVIELLF